jgi:hypothetical protein
MQAILDREQILQTAPSVYQTKPISTVSKEYAFVPTSKLIEDMGSLNWFPTKAMQVKVRARKEIREGFQKHTVVFSNPEYTLSETESPRIVVINSHDATSSFRFNLGIFRLICSNGMIVCTNNICEQRVEHSIYTMKEVEKSVYEYVHNFSEVAKDIETYRNTPIAYAQAEDFAAQALAVRYPDQKRRESSVIQPQNLLEVRRSQDSIDNLWNLFNCVQENLVHPQSHWSQPKKRVRQLKNFSEDLRVNQALWAIMAKMA